MRGFSRFLVLLMILAACRAASALTNAERRRVSLIRGEIKRRKELRKSEKDKRRKEADKLSVEAIKAAFEKGKDAFQEERYAAAYLHFKSVASCGLGKAAKMAAEAKSKQLEIERMARDKLDEAEVLKLRRRQAEAAQVLVEVIESFPHCEAADQARTRLLGLKGTPSVAASLRYAEGKAQEDAESYAEALRVYDDVNRRWPGELAALRARVAARKIRADPEKTMLAREALQAEAERACPNLINMAWNYLANLSTLTAADDQDPKAIEDIRSRTVKKLQVVLRDYPGTTYAQLASAAVEALSENNVELARALLVREREGGPEAGEPGTDR